jgi:tetratricopeptide (TPR) repeat protein
MNRIMGLILAFAVGTAIGGCASAGTAGSDGINAASGSQSARPSENRMTREANRNLGLAMLRSDPAEQRQLFENALGEAQAAIEADPENPLGWYLAGQAHAKLSDYVAADSAFKKAVALYPAYEAEIDGDREEAWVEAYNEAIGAYQAGDMDGAIQGMENASLIFWKRPEAQHILGSFYANQNEPEKAIKAFTSALNTLRTSPIVPEDEETRETWKRDEEEIAMNLGLLLTSVERHGEAADVYRELLERRPGHLGSEINLAMTLMQQDKVAEGAAIIERLNARDDLSDGDYLMIGIALFNADDFDGAADAFHSASVKNPYSHDAIYNLAKAVLRQSLLLEEERKDREDAALDRRLTEVYERLIMASEKTQGLDPFNQDVITYMMRSYQGLAQLGSDAAKQREYRGKLQGTLQQYEALPFDVGNFSVNSTENEVTVSGTVTNLKATAGQSVTLRVTILSANGAGIGSGDATVTMPAAEASTLFRVEIPVTGEIAGWKYERIQ